EARQSEQTDEEQFKSYEVHDSSLVGQQLAEACDARDDRHDDGVSRTENGDADNESVFFMNRQLTDEGSKHADRARKGDPGEAQTLGRQERSEHREHERERPHGDLADECRAARESCLFGHVSIVPYVTEREALYTGNTHGR